MIDRNYPPPSLTNSLPINQIICGDCIEKLPELPDNSIDLILTDPPYGVTACKWDSIIPLEIMWKQLKRITKPNKAIVLFGTEPFSSVLRVSNPKMYKYDWVWNKKKGGNPLLSKIQPIKVTENISVFGVGKIDYFPIMTNREKPRRRGKNRGLKSETTNNAFIEDKLYTQKYPKNIIEISNANQRNRLHPTQKPVPLMRYLIETYTNKDEIVLDFTVGSGTTCVAAKQLGRKYIGIDISEEYCDITRQRLAL